LLKAELEAQGRNSKSWTSTAGRLIGGKPFSRGALYLMLRNRTYRGEIVHQGQSHPGEHTSIIGPPLWDAVQMRLACNTTEHNSGTGTHQPSLLAGVLFDTEGNRMTPSYAVKQGTRYRYYVSRPLITRQRDGGEALPNCQNASMVWWIDPLAFATSGQTVLPPGFSFRFAIVARPRPLPLPDRSIGLPSGRDKIRL
jgi:hypothetical protein